LGTSWSCASDPATEVRVAIPQYDGGGADDDGGPSETGDAAAENRDVLAETDADVIASMTIALAPTQASVMDGGSEGEAKAEALITVLAAGSGGVVLERSWFDMCDPSGAPAPAAWDELGGMLTFVRQQHRVALVSVATVDGVLDRRPEDLRASPWSGIAMRDAVHAMVDATMSVAGEEVVYLSLGMEVDRYLTTYPAQGSAYVAFLLEAVQYAREHGNGPTGLRVGVTWSAATWLPNEEPTAAQQQLQDGMDALMLSFWAFDSDGHALDPETAAATLGSVVDNAGDVPVVLQQVAYASSPLLGSNETRQAEFVRALFGVLEPRIAAVPFIGIASLHDPSQKACVTFAEARGSPDSTELFAFWCSTGLRQRSGPPKDAFDAYLEAASGHEP
jgi:hypothetical protein